MTCLTCKHLSFKAGLPYCSNAERVVNASTGMRWPRSALKKKGHEDEWEGQCENAFWAKQKREGEVI